MHNTPHSCCLKGAGWWEGFHIWAESLLSAKEFHVTGWSWWSAAKEETTEEGKPKVCFLRCDATLGSCCRWTHLICGLTGSFAAKHSDTDGDNKHQEGETSQNTWNSLTVSLEGGKTGNWGQFTAEEPAQSWRQCLVEAISWLLDPPEIHVIIFLSLH